MEKIKNVLQKCQWSIDQISIYLELLKNGEKTILEISKNTKIPRTTVYRTLKDLVELNIVTIFKTNKQKLFSAESPKRLIDGMKQKEDLIKEIIPDFQELSEFNKNKPYTTFYEGIDGLKQSLNTLYDYFEKANIKNISTYSHEKFAEIIPKHLQYLIDKRNKLKIRVRIIAPITAKDNIYYRNSALKEVRFMPKDFIFTDSIIMGGTMAILCSVNKHNIHTVIINSESIIRTFQNLFEYNWMNLK